MNDLFNTPSRPPFYATITLTPSDTTDFGKQLDAVATLTSSALLKSGFLGFKKNKIEGREVSRIAYFDTYKSLQDWLSESNDLIPWGIKLDDIVKSKGCLWPWIEDTENHSQEDNILFLQILQ